jgi:hypothetical protein
MNRVLLYEGSSDNKKISIDKWRGETIPSPNIAKWIDSFATNEKSVFCFNSRSKWGPTIYSKIIFFIKTKPVNLPEKCPSSKMHII